MNTDIVLIDLFSGIGGFSKGLEEAGFNITHHYFSEIDKKAIAVYKWILKKYAQPGWKILDTHRGSDSLAIACHDLGFDMDGWEIDPDYHQSGIQRFQNNTSQISMF